MGNCNKEELKVLFMGNHNVGIETIKGIQDISSLIGVVAHPPDKEEGFVYESVFKYANSIGVKVIRGKGTDEHVKEFIFEMSPDVIIVADYKYLLPKEIIEFPSKGCINLHPSLLPKYRDRAPLNWAIINGENKVGLTAHIIDEGVDTGDIILQKTVEVLKQDYISDILLKLYPLYRQITRQLLGDIHTGVTEMQKQSVHNYKIYPKRKPEDGCINWRSTIKNIHNLIRAVSKPYPGAFSIIESKKIIFWRADIEKLDSLYFSLSNGSVVESCDSFFRVKCVDGILKVTDWKGGVVKKQDQFNTMENINNISLYTKLIEKHGINIKSLNWGSEVSQKLRFNILSKVGLLEGHSVLDVGCGLGDLYAWLQYQGIKCRYSGIDITPKMVVSARERFPGINFFIQDVFNQIPEKHDYILMSGVFAYQNIHSFKEMITILFQCANEAIAFNLLSSLSPDKDSGEFYADPAEILKFCQTLTSWVVLRHDYHPRDFTIYMYKKSPL